MNYRRLTTHANQRLYESTRDANSGSRAVIRTQPLVSDKRRLLGRGKPSTEAQPVLVRIITEKDWQKLKPEAHGWRRTSESLPKVVTAKDGSVNSVLVYKKDGFECGSDIQVSNTVFLRKNRKWVTHWMPLPDPPNAGESGARVQASHKL